MARIEEYLWKDPFEPSVSGAVLLSDHIQFLANEVVLVYPFEEKYLRPAAYDVRVGNSYYVNDVRKDLNDEWIEIPPNGLVYVRTKERFNIPYYLIARYRLRVHQVYRGLLIDNGLHIDPGYCGYIWIRYITSPLRLGYCRKGRNSSVSNSTGPPLYQGLLRISRIKTNWFRLESEIFYWERKAVQSRCSTRTSIATTDATKTSRRACFGINFRARATKVPC